MSIVAPISATGVVDPRARRARLGRAAGRAAARGHRARAAAASCSRRARRRARTRRRAAPGARRSGWRCSPRSASARSSPASTGRRRPATSPGCCSPRASSTSCSCSSRARSSARGCRRAPAALGAIAAVGVFDLLANLLFVLAAGRGLLSVVGVLGSLYPAFTVVLARFVLHERLTRAQGVGRRWSRWPASWRWPPGSGRRSDVAQPRRGRGGFVRPDAPTAPASRCSPPLLLAPAAARRPATRS